MPTTTPRTTPRKIRSCGRGCFVDRFRNPLSKPLPAKRTIPKSGYRSSDQIMRTKKGGGTPANVFRNLRICSMRRAPTGALACRRSTAAPAVAPLGARAAASGQASWDVAGRPALYGRPNRGAQASRCSTGVTRARLSQSSGSTPRTGRSAGQHDARSCPGADCIVPRAGTALAPLSGVPSAEGVLHRARFADENVSQTGTVVKRRRQKSDSCTARSISALTRDAARRGGPGNDEGCGARSPARGAGQAA